MLIYYDYNIKMDIFDGKLSKKRALTRLRVQKCRILQKRNRNENSSVQNSASNDVEVPSYNNMI